VVDKVEVEVDAADWTRALSISVDVRPLDSRNEIFWVKGEVVT
jgi:hypothetical protein